VRPRERILANLEQVYRAAYDQASAAEDKDRMHQLDASFQREQLILEVLLDIRDTMVTIGEADSSDGDHRGGGQLQFGAGEARGVAQADEASVTGYL
jgi:hypothetical protein